MNKPNTTCRVCGKEYFCCGDSRAVNSWRAMTCSPECFQEYMKRIDESRKQKPIETNKNVEFDSLPKTKLEKKKLTEKANKENETKE